MSAATSRPANSLKAAKDALYREHILDVAEQVFAERGFAQSRMQDIARQAGMSLATLYQNYPGKKDLHRAVLIARDQAMLNAVVGRMQAALGRQPSVVGLLWLMQSHLSFLLEHPNYLKLILHEGHAWYHSAAQPTKDEQAMWDQGLSMMSRVFEQGIQAAVLVPGDPADHARLLMALQQARLASWVAAGMVEDHAAVIARIQADFVRQFCRPGEAARLLSEDGASLSDRTKSSLQGVDQSEL